MLPLDRDDDPRSKWCYPGVTPDSKSGRGGRIRTGGPLRPRQVRYQAALRPDSEDPRFFCGFLQVAPSRASLFGRKLSQNCPRTPTDCPRIPRIHHPACPRTPADSFAARLSFCQRLALHLHVHMRVLLEHLRVALAEKLRYPLIGDAACAQARRVRRSQIVDAEMWHLRPPKRQPPRRLERALVSRDDRGTP